MYHLVNVLVGLVTITCKLFTRAPFMKNHITHLEAHQVGTMASNNNNSPSTDTPSGQATRVDHPYPEPSIAETTTSDASIQEKFSALVKAPMHIIMAGPMGWTRTGLMCGSK
jgi:hypothetical protein